MLLLSFYLRQCLSLRFYNNRSDLTQFGLLKIALGGHAFSRDKYVFIQYTGERASAVKRGRHVSMAKQVEEAMGGAHLSLVFYDEAEMTVDGVLARL
eukprot:SAG22_NODE_110_length_19679_cov_45.046527_13_plen_97_part_00